MMATEHVQYGDGVSMWEQLYDETTTYYANVNN